MELLCSKNSALLSSFGASKILISRYANFVDEMILKVENTLEAIINYEEELRIAVEVLRKTPVLVDKLNEDKELTKEEFETINPVIEQQLDPESYENTSYSIDIGDGATTKSYYESFADAQESDNGASYSAVVSHEHELLQEAQEIARNIHEGDVANRPYIEASIDIDKRHAKDSIKIFSPALWHVMYEGKLIFN